MPRTVTPQRITPEIPERLLRLLREHYPPPDTVRTGPAHQLGVDVRAAAQAAGIERSTLYRLLQGGRCGQIETIEAICLACGTDLRGLYVEAPPPNRANHLRVRRRRGPRGDRRRR